MNLHTLGTVQADGSVYFSELYFNALFRMDLNSYKLNFVTSFHGFEKNSIDLFRKPCAIGNKLYFIPAHTNKVAVYDRKERLLYYIDFDYSKDGNLLDADTDGLHLRMVMNCYPNDILNVHLVTGQVEKKALDWDKITKTTKYDLTDLTYLGKQHYFFGSKIEGDRCWLLPRLIGHLFSYNFGTCQTQIWKVNGFKNSCFSSVETDGGSLWLSVLNKSILLNYNIQEQRVIEEVHYGIPQNELYGDLLIVYGHVVIVASYYGVFIMDKKSKERKEFVYEKGMYAFCYEIYRNKIILFPYIGNQLVIIDPENMGIREIGLVWGGRDEGKDIFDFAGLYLKEESCGLPEYLANIGGLLDKGVTGSKCIGNNIWTKIKGLG